VNLNFVDHPPFFDRPYLSLVGRLFSVSRARRRTPHECSKASSREVDMPRVARHDGKAGQGALLQIGGQAHARLHGYHPRRPLGRRQGERAPSGADLEERLVRAGRRESMSLSSLSTAAGRRNCLPRRRGIAAD
jgi:hypothetical protein